MDIVLEVGIILKEDIDPMVDQDSLLVVGLGSLEVVLDNLLVDLMVDISLMEDIALVVDIDLDEVGTGLVVGINLEVDILPFIAVHTKANHQEHLMVGFPSVQLPDIVKV